MTNARRIVNVCFVSLALLLTLGAASVTAGNRNQSDDVVTDHLRDNSAQTSIITQSGLQRIDRPAIPVGPSPFNALGRREVSEYQHVDLNVDPERAGCIGDECDEKQPPTVETTRALGKDKKCKDKKKGKPDGEDCEKRDSDGCCIVEDDGSGEGKSDEGDNDDKNKKESDDSDEKKSDGDSSENDDDKDDKEKKAEAAKKAREKEEADAKKKKEEEEKKKAKEEAESREKEEAKKEAEAKVAKKKAKADAEAKKEEQEDEKKRLKEETEKKADKKRDDDNDSDQSDESKPSEDKVEKKKDGGGDGSAKKNEKKKDDDNDSDQSDESKPSDDNDSGQSDESKPSDGKDSDQSDESKPSDGKDSDQSDESKPSDGKDSDQSDESKPSEDSAKKVKSESKEEPKSEKGGAKEPSGDAKKGDAVKSAGKKDGGDVSNHEKADTSGGNKGDEKSSKSKGDNGPQEKNGVEEKKAATTSSKKGNRNRTDPSDKEILLLSQENSSGSRGGGNNAAPSENEKSKKGSKPKFNDESKQEEDKISDDIDAADDDGSSNISKESKAKPSIKSKDATTPFQRDGADDNSNGDSKKKGGSDGEESRVNDIELGFDLKSPKGNSKGGANQSEDEENRASDPSPKLKGSHHPSQSLRSKYPQSKVNGRPPGEKSPNGEQSVNRVGSGSGDNDDLLAASRSQNRDGQHGEDSHQSSKKPSSFVVPDIDSGPNNRDGPSHPKHRPSESRSNPDQPDLHSPGGAGRGDPGRGPVPTCLSNCGTRARSSMKDCKVTIKARSPHEIEECVTLSEALFDACAYSCVQGRGPGQSPGRPHDRPNRPGGSDGRPNHPDDRPRSTPGGGGGVDRSSPRPGNGRPGGGTGNDNDTGVGCKASCWAENNKIKGRWCASDCPNWIDDYLRRCINLCQPNGDGDSYPSPSRPGPDSQEDNDSDGGDCDEICDERVEARIERCEARPSLQQGRAAHHHHSSEDCHSHVVVWRRRCIGRCQNGWPHPWDGDGEEDDSGGNGGSGDEFGTGANGSQDDDESDNCASCTKQKAEKLLWCKGLTGQQRSRQGIDTCTPWTNDWYGLCLQRCHDDNDGGAGEQRSETSPSEDGGQDAEPLPTEVIICKATCKSNARSKESWCNRSSKDERNDRGVSDDNCSEWADELRLKCYDGCYENAKIVEAESIPKGKQSDDDSKKNINGQGSGRNDPEKGAKPEPQKAEKEKRQEDMSKAQDSAMSGDDEKEKANKGKYNKEESVKKGNGDVSNDNDASSSDQPWIGNKISDPKKKDRSHPISDDGRDRPPNNAGIPKPKPPPHPHIPGTPEDPSEQMSPEQGSSASSSNPVDISNNGVDIDSFAIDLSIALRSNGSLETIKVRTNSGSAVRADQDNVRNRLIIQDGVIRVLRHVLEEELGYHVRQEEWDHRLRQLRQRELVTLHHDIDQTVARTVNLGATSRDGLSVKWIKFSVFYDILDFLTNDHSSMITGLDVALRSVGSGQSSHLHALDQQPHLLLTGRQIASAARAAVSGRIRDGTLVQLLRFRGVDALAVTEFGDEANVSFDQGWIDEMPVSSSSSDDGIPGTTIDSRSSDKSDQSWDPTRLVGAGVFVLFFALIVGTAQWTWNQRRQRREMEWTTAGAQEHFHTGDVEYEEWQTRISPGEGTPSESGGSMVIDVNTAIQSDKISSLGIGTFSEVSVAGWQPRGAAGRDRRYSREPSNFSSIVRNAYDSVSPSDAALDLIGEELDDNSRGQLV